jgi:cystathionine beta-lyase/cystathionine gamma-synthase
LPLGRPGRRGGARATTCVRLRTALGVGVACWVGCIDVVAIGGIGPIGDDFLPALRTRLAGEHAIPPEGVIVNASHCHAAVCRDVADRVVAAVAEAKQKRVAVKAGALLVVDNCFCSPAIQRPFELGADIVIHSATKFLDGQGRVLGGAVLGRRELVMGEIFGFLRTAGPSMSAFNAWVILKGMETLSIRMREQSERALELARWLEGHPRVERVLYPGLESHPQFALAKRQQSASGEFLGGAVVSFVAKGGREEAWRVVDNCKVISVTANLGDTKSTITHPASTTHGRISKEAREAAGIGEGLLRVSVGLESLADVKADLARGLG